MHESEQLLQLIDSNPEAKFLFQTIGQSRNLNRTLYGTFKEHEAQLHKINSQGGNVYFTVNKTKGNRRKKEDIISTRAIWQEDDTSTKKIPKGCNAVVQTSPGKFHRYWLYQTDDLTTWENLQRNMCRFYDSDPNAKDLARLLRLPGFMNHKYNPAQPVKLLELNPQTDAISIEEQLTKQFESDSTTKSQHTSNKVTEAIQQIITGQHLHGPLRFLMMLNANKGMSAEDNQAYCLGLIHACPDQQRKSTALKDLPAQIRATYNKIEEEEEPEELLLPPDETKIDLDWPPGQMGELAKAAYDFMVLPNKLVATMTALSLIAGITGRRYNISASGLNIYVTILMPTGGGKDSIRKFCVRVLTDSTLLGANGLSFLGPQNFTSGKALIKQLHTNPAMLSIRTEAGLMGKTESGDKPGLRRVELQAYSSSGKHDLISPEAYSHEQDSTALVRAPALTILNETTPHNFLEVVRKNNSIESGEIPRMWIFNLEENRPYPNPIAHQFSTSSEVMVRVKDLIQDCYKVQNSTTPDVIDIPVPAEFHSLANYYTDLYNECIDTEPSKAMMYTRAAHNILKIAALISVFNNESTVSDIAITWATKLFDLQMSQISNVLLFDSSVDIAAKYALHIVYKLVNKEYKKQSFKQPQGVFTKSNFKQYAQQNSAIRALGTSARYGSPKSGAEVMLNYLVNEGYIAEYSKNRQLVRYIVLSKAIFTVDAQAKLKHKSQVV